jgi:hypothetical protein
LSPSARSSGLSSSFASAWLIQTLNFCSGTEKSHKHRSISMQSQIKSSLSNRLQHLPLRLPSVAFPSSTSRMSYTLFSPLAPTRWDPATPMTKLLYPF